jgi:hypothetical protein
MKTFRSMRMRYPALIAALLLSALNLQALPIFSCSSTFNANVPGATYNVKANLLTCKRTLPSTELMEHRPALTIRGQATLSPQSSNPAIRTSPGELSSP